MHTVESLSSDLRALGAQEGGTLIVHSSYKAIGPTRGGPESVCRALTKTIGPLGLLVIPTFTFGRYSRFSVKDSPSLTGAVTEVFRKMEGVHRSEHPTHATALWGASAETLALSHAKTAGLDIGSPFHVAAQKPGALILLAGIDSRANSYIHVCESLIELPYVEETFWNGRVYTYEVIPLRGKPYTRENRRAPGCSNGFVAVDRELERTGALRRAKLGAADCLVIRPEDILQAVRTLTNAKADALLCNNPMCGFCPSARDCLRKYRMI